MFQFHKLSIAMALPLILAMTASAKEKTISVKLTVPDATYGIEINEVYQVDKELWVISTISKAADDIMGAQMISIVESSVVVDAEDLPERHFILGKTWKWTSKEPHIFLKDRGRLKEKLKDAKVLYEKKKKDKKKS